MGFGGFGMGGDGRITAAIELWRTTGERKYRDFFEPKVLAQLKPIELPQGGRVWTGAGRQGVARGVEVPQGEAIGGNGGWGRMGFGGVNLATALSIYKEMDASFQAQVRAALPAYVEGLKAQAETTPYGVPISGRSWGGNEQILSWALNCYNVWRLFPDAIDPELVLSGLNYLYGCHPYSNESFITAVGAKTKKVAYGNNRADYTVIPGGLVPGLLLMAPDYMENKDDYPFHWGENECCTRNVVQLVTIAHAAEEITAALAR